MHRHGDDDEPGPGFGQPLGTQFAWRSRLLIYNPRARVSAYTPYGPWNYDVMPNPSGYIPLPGGGAIFVMGPSGLILPDYSPTSTWTISGGVWATPYIQVSGREERPVNVTDVDRYGRYDTPNWCWYG